MTAAFLLGVALNLAFGLPGFAADASPPDPPGVPDLKKLPLEELLQVEVVSAAKKPQRVLGTAHAVYVLSGEDIRRSGATSIPEALRLVPGVNVARLSANKWAVSIRGFNAQFSSKLLVMIDGRAVYSPLFQGVVWEAQDVFMDDIDRIEVIRGPGGALWGSNAVNGVINVITRHSRDTPGPAAYAGGGTEEKAFTGVRYGGKLSEDSAFRAFGKYFDRGPQLYPDGSRANDRWRMGRLGARADWSPTSQDELEFRGDAYRGKIGDTKSVPNLGSPTLSDVVEGDDDQDGGSLQAGWRRGFASGSELELTFDYTHSNVERLGVLSSRLDVINADFQMRSPWVWRQEIVWGLGYRATWGDVDSLGAASFSPSDRTTHLNNLFFQDEVALIEDRLSLSFGTKFERNDFTGWEIQPDGRLLLTPREGHAAWAAVSRAVRTPAFSDNDGTLDLSAIPPGIILRFESDPDFKAEEVLAYELGYRVQAHPRLSVDLAAFYNLYHHQRTLEPGPVEPGPPPVLPLRGTNARDGDTHGGELALAWQAAARWRLHAAYSYLKMRIPGGVVPADQEAGDSPRNQFVLRSLLDLPGAVELDGALRYVDTLPSQSIPSYVTGDARLSWRPIPDLELSLVGQNLGAPRHIEFASSVIMSRATVVQRGVYGKVAWRL